MAKEILTTKYLHVFLRNCTYYLFLAVLALRLPCSFSAGERGHSLGVVGGHLYRGGFSCCGCCAVGLLGFSVVAARGLSCGLWALQHRLKGVHGLSWIRD